MVKRYSLWIIPDGGLYKKLDNLISEISAKYQSPVFKPHVTLLGSAAGNLDSIISETSELASSIKPYDIHLTSAGCFDEYFRSLFIKVKKTGEVMGANLAAERLLGNDDSVYFPHLSLMYGNFSTEIKKGILSEIGEIFNLTFSAKSFHLYDTGGAPEEWHCIREFPLGGE